MKIIDIKDVGTAAMCYAHVPQPMAVYHSREEFLANESTSRWIIGSLGEYLDFVKANNISLQYNANNKYIDVKDMNVWVRTVDKFIPDTTEFSGVINYKLDEGGNKIPTDGCFIRLYYITPTPTRNVFYTSSGVHTVGMTKWEPTAAIRYNYSQESDPRRGQDKQKQYDDRLVKTIRKRTPTVQMTRVISAMLNPASIHFLDFNGATKAVYPWLKAPDRSKLLETESFKRTLMSVLKTFFPDLAPAIRKVHDPDAMAEKLQTAFKIAEEKKDTKAMLDVFGAILTTGYQEDMVVNDVTGQVIGAPQPQLGASNDKENPTDNFISGEPDYKMSSLLPDTEVSEEEFKKSYPESVIGMDNDEINKMLDLD